MTAKAHRSRSTTVAASRRTSQNNPRPVSRASTVSVHSRSNRASPSPRLTHAQLSQGTQSNGNTNGDVYANYDPQFSQGTLDSKPYPDFPLDNAGMPHNGGMVQYDHSMGMNGLPNGHMQSFPPHFFDPNTFDEEDRTEQGSVEPEAKRKGKGGKSIDKQMEEHVEVYKDKDITHIAQDVKRLEGTPESERPKLAFAIRWLQQYCRWAPKQNCPKNRVYRRYGERANIEGGVILNPASFGKCVKFVFRDLQTRRLGVRGESKYHYVDLEIVPESEEYSSADLQRLQSGRGTSQAIGAPEMPQLTNVTSRPSGDTAPFPDQEPSFPTAYQEYENPPDQARVFINPTQPQWNTQVHTAQWYQQTLKLPTHMDSDPSSADEGPLDVPPVWRYAPSKTDTDAANTLQSLYWNHCNSVIDAVRFCKERNFFHLFTSFNGTMTVPTQKLYNHVSMAPWIKEADWSMYKRIAENVSRLALEAVPTQAIAFLSNVANRLHEHISKAFENHPSHVLEAKLEPAALFCNILKRMLKANQSAHAAARLLVDDAARDQMWFDVVKYVQPKNILETEVPMCGYEEVYRILTHDIRQILQPRNTSRLLEFGTHYQEAAQVAEADPNYYSLNTPIERIAEWLLELPKRFPQTSARTVLNCITGITGAIGRELTVENAPSLQIWFVVKCFIDDLSWYYAFHAGFCAHRASDPSFDTSQSFDADTTFMDQSGDNLGLDNAEDSGIGMSLLDDIPTK